MNDKLKLIKEYFQKVQAANKELTKKEAFKDLLNRLYFGNPEIQKIIDKITAGAEATVLNIPRRDKLHKGSADTLYNNIIIEFENDLRVTYKHAKEQLAGYLLGKMHSGFGYDFTLIASDFINWKVLTPDVSCVDKLETLQEHELILNETDFSFTLTENNFSDFYYWLDRFLFRENKQIATLKNIEEAFGFQSNIFIESYRELNKWYNDAKKFGEIQVSFEQWHRFLSIAYGHFDKREDTFLIHTYLSVFSKMLAYSVVSNNDYIDDNELLNILNGSIFQKFNIINFVDNDFFHWVSDDRNFPKLKKVFRLIAQELSAFDFDNVNEDILKGVYQELIDIDTRHRLGEYYTPDWLCERIVSEFDFGKCKKVLDPSCGSGSFLRAAIAQIKRQNPEKTPEEISRQVYGIDIHPLSVQIAKTTILLALGEERKNIEKPIRLNILLANTLYSPINENTLFGDKFEMPIDKEKYSINTLILNDVNGFNKALDVCDELSAERLTSKMLSEKEFGSVIVNLLPEAKNDEIKDSYYNIYQGFRKAKLQKRDGIWKFIISNQYKPYFLYEFFDYIIGNPPWLTYSSVNTEDYQNVLNKLAIKYDVKPKQAKDYPHLEIAAIFLAHCSRYFLKDTGKLAFVLPRAFFSGSQHKNTRNGTAKGFRLIEIWDLLDVKPLFNIPSCVFFVEKKGENQNGKVSTIAGQQLTGTLNAHNCHYDDAKTQLTENKVNWYLIETGKETAFSTKKNKSKNRLNPYKLEFKQGATIVPRSFYFVDITNKDLDNNDISIETAKKLEVVSIKTSTDILLDAKAPWKSQLSGQVETEFLFRTAISKSILPFYLHNPSLISLPVTISQDSTDNIKKINVHTAEELMKKGKLKAWRWFANDETIWDLNKTDKSKNMSASDRLDFQRGLNSQNLNCRYLVLYTASAKDAHSVVIDRQDIDFEFITESKTYVFYTNNENEAFYLSAILNSTKPNELMKDFQTRGLFGPRDIHKKILDIYFPKYNELTNEHLRLAKLGQTCHDKASEYIKQNPPADNLPAIQLGKLRVEIKKYLAPELADIDKIAEKLIK